MSVYGSGLYGSGLYGGAGVASLMDPVYTGRIGDGDKGQVDGRKDGTVGDTVGGLVREEGFAIWP